MIDLISYMVRGRELTFTSPWMIIDIDEVSLIREEKGSKLVEIILKEIIASHCIFSFF